MNETYPEPAEEQDVATVRASCPTCGDVELTTRHVQVDLCETTQRSSYSFQCPSCGVRVSKDASDKVVRILCDAGVYVHTWHMPELRTSDRTGPAISYDDLLAFHFQLRDDEVVAQLLSSTF
jgi:predicted RNA-binding Zn-ribbon protein involved in translation (DUF1610 family)